MDNKKTDTKNNPVLFSTNRFFSTPLAIKFDDEKVPNESLFLFTESKKVSATFFLIEALCIQPPQQNKKIKIPIMYCFTNKLYEKLVYLLKNTTFIIRHIFARQFSFFIPYNFKFCKPRLWIRKL